jgi:hypothetical protein
MKQAQAKPKKSFAEAMGDRIKSLTEVRLEKEAAIRRTLFQEQEDEVMLMTHGPNWRTRYAGDPAPREEYEVPAPQESGVQLKAS